LKIYSFEKLDVWQKARELNLLLYKMTKDFPKEEIYGITSQIRRAGISITCNIAEGTSRWSNKEKVRYLEIAFGSLMEVLNCLIIATDLEYINEEVQYTLRETVDIVGSKLNNLKVSFEKDLNK
jgi:four helix bundle protein